MKRFLITLSVSFGFIMPLYAQTVQWATKVIEFSSELTPIQYSAQQVLGKPNVLPAGGQSPNAWAPDRPNRKEFLKVGFANPISIRQIAIAESHNPSALTRVLAYDVAGKEYVIHTLTPNSIPLKGRMLNVFMEPTPYKVAAVKLEFDGAAVTDYYGIDAIGISDAGYPVIADIPKMQLLASGIVIEALDKNVNSEYSELNPLLSPDGKTLYFSRRNHPENIGGVGDKEDIWYSQLDSTGHWQIARNIGPGLNTNGPNFINTIQSVTPDGQSAIMVLGNKYLDNGKMMAGVSISTQVNGEWTKPVPINIINDYNYSAEANYFLTNSRTTLLMSVQREDSYGDRDLYVTFMKNDSVWSEPLNLGDMVNTASEESSPFLAPDGKTLYFSSNGYSGYGGSDIYVTHRLDDTWTNWSDPENLGPEINSPLEDIFFNIPVGSDYAYYSRGVSQNNTDIFRIKLPIIKVPEVWVTVKGKILDKKTGQPLSAKVIYEILPGGEDLGVVQSNAETGDYEFKLPAGKQYAIRAEADGKLAESQSLDLRNVKSDKIIADENFQLQTLEVNATIELNNVFFDFDKASLKAESFPELDRLVELMNQQSNMKVEISGHTDGQGSERYNLALSEKRAKAVVQYMVGKGINKKRIVTLFFGESKPVATNDTPEGREKNRRVEFKIVKL